jgi:hypothetical protein
MSEEAVRAAFASQVHWCTTLGSPLTARLTKLLGERLDRSTAVGRRVLDWPGDPAPEGDNVPARMCGAFHFLVRTGEAPGLAALYPPAPLPSEATLWAALEPLLAARQEVLDSFLDSAPQTNEVGRSAGLMAGLIAVSDRFALPLRLIEQGSSAGLNLNLDRYGHRLGGRSAGVADSPLRLAPLWRGPPPPDAPVRILGRSGVDLSPRDPAAESERLLAFVWADQRERLARMEAALSIAAAHPPGVEQGDAAEWLERVLPAAAAEGAVRVVMHSLAFQYFPSETQQRITRLMERLGAGADEERPLAWLSYEQLRGEERASLRLRLWPDGEERLLGFAHPHGRYVEWLG